VAARLEGIAEPSGICISSSAYDQVRGSRLVKKWNPWLPEKRIGTAFAP
jgi:class 3 adenylate cyclase